MDVMDETGLTRIAIVDDHPVVVRGLREFFEDEPSFEVVGVADDLDGFLDILARERPDIALVDLKLGGDEREDVRPSGLDLIAQARAIAPHLSYVVYSAYEKYVMEAIQVGAAAYVLKDTEMDRLATILWNVHHLGQGVFPIGGIRPLPKEARLTRREREVLCEWVKHPEDTRAAVARGLGISEGAVRAHLRNIYQKLEIHSRAEAMRKARELGLC
jgi:NarL family two-component system response regulator YdfI